MGRFLWKPGSLLDSGEKRLLSAEKPEAVLADVARALGQDIGGRIREKIRKFETFLLKEHRIFTNIKSETSSRKEVRGKETRSNSMSTNLS
jgi:hypothetical protein